MAGKKQDSGLLAIKAINKFPNSSKQSIAAYLYTNHPTVYNSVDHARRIIRNYTNGTSLRMKKQIVHETNFTAHNPYGLPAAKERESLLVHLPAHLNNILWISDIHFPNHNVNAINTALQYGKDNKVNCIVIGGDLLDNEPFSRHEGNPPPTSTDVRDWFDMAENFLFMLKEKFPECEIYFMEGNHDAWYKRFLISKCAVIFQDEYYTLQSRLGLRDKNIAWIPDTQILMAGILPLMHGHKVVKASKTPASALFNKILYPMLIGHCHQTMEVFKYNAVNGNITKCYSTGCLCTLTPAYDPLNPNHNLGFARIIVSLDGNFKVENKKIDPTTFEIS
jgi:predicted phosphodiesterase